MTVAKCMPPHREYRHTMLLDALFINGRIRTGNPLRPTTGSLGVHQGRIVSMGAGSHGMRAARVIDLDGAHVVPGFHDAHFHLSGLGQMLQHCDLTPSVAPTLDALYRRIRSFAADHPESAWIIGEGFDSARMGGVPHRRELDAVTDGRPTWLIHASHHAGVMNSAAMAAIGYEDSRELPDIDGGVVGRDADGQADGYLAERAMRLITDVIRPGSRDAFVEAIGLGSDAALAMGITSVTEPGISGALTGNGPHDYADFERALHVGRLRVRATLMPEYAAVKAGLDRERCAPHADRLKLGPVKIFADGAISGRTAALRCAYAHPSDAGRGGMLVDAGDLRNAAIELHGQGWRIATHAIGDLAVDHVLDAYAAAMAAYPRDDPRHRIEHAAMLDDRQITRLRELGITPVPQASFVTEFGDAYLDALGPARANLLYRQRSLLEAGIVVPGSSDCPVVPGAPLLGIQALVTRATVGGAVLNADERISVDQALRNYTFGSAFADHAEQSKGTLEPGKLADFAVISHDLVAAPAERIGAIQVLGTVVGGEVVFGDLGA